MALKNTSDPQLIATRLASWLPAVLSQGTPVTVTDVVVPEASGMSSETVLLTASWSTPDGSEHARGLVLRIPAPADQEPLFPDTDIAREAVVMRAVRAHSSAPVPEVLAHEATGEVIGRPFLLLDRLYGEVPADDPPYSVAGWVAELTDEQRATLYDEALQAIASVQIDPVEAGLVDVLSRPGLGSSVLRQELAHWRNTYDWARAGKVNPTIEAAFDLLEAKVPEGGRLSLSWGDSRFGNLMFGSDQQVTGIFDWEMASLGQPEMDLGLFLITDLMYEAGMGLPRMGGFPSQEDAVARYAELIGEPVRDMDWFIGWAGIRGSIMIMRIANMLIDLGGLPADSTLPHANPATNALAMVMGLPAPAGASATDEIFAGRGTGSPEPVA